MLVDAKALGFHPPDIARSTGCWKGFLFEVSIDERGLLLRSMRLAQDEGVPYPVINGVRPTIDREDVLDARYDGIDLRIDFTGSVRVARQIDQRIPAPIYDTPPYIFRSVLDAEFAHGELIRIENRSAHFATYRRLHADRIRVASRCGMPPRRLND